MFVLGGAFTGELAVGLCGAGSDICAVLDADDKPTWDRERIRVMMRRHQRERTSTFASKVYDLSPSNEVVDRFLYVREVVKGLFDNEEGIALNLGSEWVDRKDLIPHKEPDKWRKRFLRKLRSPSPIPYAIFGY